MDGEEVEFPQQQAFVVKNQGQSQWCVPNNFEGMKEETNAQMADPLYLRALMDPELHLTVEGKINSVPACSLIDSGAIGIFMNLQFAQQCRAEVIPKVIS